MGTSGMHTAASQRLSRREQRDQTFSSDIARYSADKKTRGKDIGTVEAAD
jgi:hypothetical protein